MIAWPLAGAISTRIRAAGGDTWQTDRVSCHTASAASITRHQGHRVGTRW